MKTRQMPRQNVALADSSGRVKVQWWGYLEGIEQHEVRVSALVANLGAAPTNAQIAVAFNDLLTNLKAAGLMETT